MLVGLDQSLQWLYATSTNARGDKLSDGGGEPTRPPMLQVMVSSLLQGSDTFAECPMWHRA